MDAPKVSILVPVYNGERYLKQTLESAHAQTYENLELVIVNDASTDGSADIVARFSEGKENVIAVMNSENKGLCGTVNRAVSECSGDYFITLGQDDILEPDHVAEIMKCAGEAVAFVHCNPRLIDSAGKPLDDNPVRGEGVGACLRRLGRIVFQCAVRSPLTKQVLRPCFSSTGLLVNRRLFEAVGGFDETYRNLGEYLLWVRLSRVGGIRFCPAVRPQYRVHPSSLIHRIGGGRDPESDLMTRYYAHCRREAMGNPRLPAWKKIAISPLYFSVYIAGRRNLKRDRKAEGDKP